MTSKDYQEALALLSISLLGSYPITAKRLHYKTAQLSNEQIDKIVEASNKSIKNNKTKLKNCGLL